MTVRNEQIEICDAKFLPIVAVYVDRISLVEVIDAQLHCKMEVSPGRVVVENSAGDLRKLKFKSMKKRGLRSALAHQCNLFGCLHVLRTNSQKWRT